MKRLRRLAKRTITLALFLWFEFVAVAYGVVSTFTKTEVNKTTAMTLCIRRLSPFCGLVLYFLLISSCDAQQRETIVLLDDTNFQRGFVVWTPKPGKKVRAGELIPLDNHQPPVWQVAQWHSRFDMSQANRQQPAPGVVQFYDGAKLLKLNYNRTATTITLGLNGSTEYQSKPPQRGAAWPHLLLERPLLAHPALSDLESVPFQISYRLLKQKPTRNEGWDKRRHTAQFLLYITIQNRNRSSAGFGDYYWFGVSMYDARHRHTPPHKTADKSSEHKLGTGKFIFNPAGKRYTTKSAHDREWITIQRNLLPLMKEGLEDAWKKGFLDDSQNLSDYHLGGLNIGWEVTGTWDVAMQVKNLSLQAQKKTD